MQWGFGRVGRTVRAILLWVLLPAVAIACDGGTSLGPECTNVSIQVSAGTTPTFTWTAECRASALRVYRTTLIWSVEALPNAVGVPVPFGPPVTYGVTPPSTSASAPEPLVAGVEYVVALDHLDPWFGGSYEMGRRTFVP